MLLTSCLTSMFVNYILLCSSRAGFKCVLLDLGSLRSQALRVGSGTWPLQALSGKKDYIHPALRADESRSRGLNLSMLGVRVHGFEGCYSFRPRNAPLRHRRDVQRPTRFSDD
jgi:hypothetical protein